MRLLILTNSGRPARGESAIQPYSYFTACLVLSLVCLLYLGSTFRVSIIQHTINWSGVLIILIMDTINIDIEVHLDFLGDLQMCLFDGSMKL